MDFIFYVEKITEKYPHYTKSGIVATIKKELYEGIKWILEAYKVFDKKDKLVYLNKLDISLKMLKIYARVSYKRKFITIRNYEAWSRKINIVSIHLGGWINSCLRQ